MDVPLIVVLLLGTFLPTVHGEHSYGEGEDPGEMKLSHSLILDPDNKYHLYWGFNKTHITFKVEVETFGYIGLGFSPNGAMVNSDIMIGWIRDDDLKPVLTDRFSYIHDEPTLDLTQDFHLHYGSQNSSHTVLKFSRFLRICDSSDRTIKEETVRLIWAYHEMDPQLDGTGATYHGINRGSRSVYLLNPIRAKVEIPEDSMTVDLLAQDILIPSDHTTYICQSFPIPKFDRKHHLIKIAPVIKSGREAEVHHMVLYGCVHDLANLSSVHTSHVCRHPSMPEDWRQCTMAVFAWAVGGGDFYFPEHVGLPLGIEHSPTVFLLEVHYDNPRKLSGMTDSSGFRLTLTPNVRQHDAGLLLAGYEPSDSIVIPPFSPSFRVDGHCTKRCLQEAMEGNANELKVFAVAIHSHTAGYKMRVRHFRDGLETKPLATDESYDFNSQSMRMLGQEEPVKSGDNILTECFYNTLDRSQITYGGRSPREEMCLSFIMYYPKIPLNYCWTSVHPHYLAFFAEATLNDTFYVTSPSDQAGKHWKELMEEEIDWSDPKVRDDFQRFNVEPEYWGTYAVCSGVNKTYSVNGEMYTVPEILYRYPMEDEHACTAIRSNGSKSTVATSGRFVAFVIASLVLMYL